jgi:Putative transposase
MAERAAHLVDHVFPAVPVRQWVLTLPHRIRYLLAWDHVLCRAVVIVQRFGAALNMNIHAHAMVLDGVFAEDAARGGLHFFPCQPPTDAEMDAVLATIAWRVRRVLVRRGVFEDEAGTRGPRRTPCWPD